LYNDDAAVTTTDLGSDQPTHQLDSAVSTVQANYDKKTELVSPATDDISHQGALSLP
jgi:hypothetical protein